jgi:hypothetical protein
LRFGFAAAFGFSALAFAVFAVFGFDFGFAALRFAGFGSSSPADSSPPGDPPAPASSSTAFVALRRRGRFGF